MKDTTTPKAINKLVLLQQDFKAKMQKEIAGAKQELKQALEDVAIIYAAINEAGEKNIWREPALEPVLTLLGLKDSKQLSLPIKRRAPNKEYPEIALDTIKTFIADNGNKVSSSILVETFGPKFNEWRKTNAKQFNLTQEGTSKFWTNK
jgi:hypothetical protein